MNTSYDVLIVGGGPGGLQAALSLGRARRRVLLCDSGPRRNAAAKGVNNFVTRDGVAPEQFRSEARAQLERYPNVEVRDARVERLTGARGAFDFGFGSARRVLLATGMVDEPPALEGLTPLWGHSVFQCPYCHGWEAGARWGYLAPEGLPAPHVVMFVLQMRGWSNEVTLFARELPQELAAKLRAAGVRLEGARVQRLAGSGAQLEAVELDDGRRVELDALFMHPPQRQVPLVLSLGVALDEEGFVKVDSMTRETSVPGVYAAGDLATRLQAAVVAAAAGMQAAAVLNAELSAELALKGAL